MKNKNFYLSDGKFYPWEDYRNGWYEQMLGYSLAKTTKHLCLEGLPTSRRGLTTKLLIIDEVQDVKK